MIEPVVVEVQVWEDMPSLARKLGIPLAGLVYGAIALKIQTKEKGIDELLTKGVNITLSKQLLELIPVPDKEEYINDAIKVLHRHPIAEYERLYRVGLPGLGSGKISKTKD